MDIARTGQKKKKRMRQLAYGVGIAAVVIALFAWLSRLEYVMTVEKETVFFGTVKQGELVRKVRGPGTLVSEEEQWISAATEGQVRRIVELAGVAVQPDTVILELVNPELEQQSEDARLALLAAQANYRDLEVTLASELLNQRALAASVAADYETAKLDAAADQELWREGLVPEIKQKKTALRERQLAEKSEIEKERLTKIGASNEAKLASERAKVEQLQAVYDLRRRQVDELIVRAGMAGVLQEVPLEPGQRVTPGSNLALVADPGNLKAELQIPQVQAKDLSLGQTVEIDTRNGLVAGRIKRVDPAVRDGSVTVDVHLEGELPPGARPDLSVDGTVEIERLDNVVYVSRPILGQPNGRIDLFKMVDDEIAERTTVELGRSSVNEIEVLSGLEVGDVVILSDPSDWEGLDRIRLK